MEHCLINGSRCSKCCEVLTIRESKNFREWRAYLRRYGDSELCSKKHAQVIGNSIFSLVIKISKRRAKKINSHLVSKVNNDQAYFKCRNHSKGKGCLDYENRPYTCSGYPYYGKTKEEFKKLNTKPDYTADCTFYVGNNLK